MKSINRVLPILIFAIAIFAVQTSLAAPTPILISGGNPNCATLNALADTAHGGAFAHMTEDYEFKIDPPVAGAHPLTGSGLTGGMSANANMALNLALNPAGTELTMWSLSWTAPQFVDRLVSAVIIKGGSGGANAYPYNPLDTGDTGPFVLPTGQQISHISFCFELRTGPSAGDASVAGRVVDRTGRGISSAILTLVNLSTGETKYASTNSFGYYKFTGLPVENVYNLDVRASRYTFNEAVRTFSLNDDLTSMDFTATR